MFHVDSHWSYRLNRFIGTALRNFDLRINELLMQFGKENSWWANCLATRIVSGDFVLNQLEIPYVYLLIQSVDNKVSGQETCRNVETKNLSRSDNIKIKPATVRASYKSGFHSTPSWLCRTLLLLASRIVVPWYKLQVKRAALCFPHCLLTITTYTYDVLTQERID